MRFDIVIWADSVPVCWQRCHTDHQKPQPLVYLCQEPAVATADHGWHHSFSALCPTASILSPSLHLQCPSCLPYLLHTLLHSLLITDKLSFFLQTSAEFPNHTVSYPFSFPSCSSPSSAFQQNLFCFEGNKVV